MKSPNDLFKLNIIDWNRLNGYWSNPLEALQSVGSWFTNTSHYTVMAIDITKAPQRTDFPGWDHVGHHEQVGELYWNWFHANHKGELHFSDSPDFYGNFQVDEGKCGFYGDIGKASPIALASIQKQMVLGDIWISIVNEEKQVIIEPFVSLMDLFFNFFLEPAISTPPVLQQLPLF